MPQASMRMPPRPDRANERIKLSLTPIRSKNKPDRMYAAISEKLLTSAVTYTSSNVLISVSMR